MKTTINRRIYLAEEMRLGRPLAAGLSFSLPASGSEQFQEVQPWLDLLQKGTFSAESLKYLPLSYQTTDAWFDMISSSASKGMTWLHALHIGINLAERGGVEAPRQYFQTSVDALKNPIAYRCLGVLSPNYETAWSYYDLAWSVLHSDFTADPAYDRLTANLVMEMSFFLQQTGWLELSEWFLAEVPPEHRGIDAYVTLQVKYMLSESQYDGALSLLGKNCFPTYAKARDDLVNMWFAAQEGLARLQKVAASGDEGASLNALERHQARVKNPPPESIGCQYAAEVGVDTVFYNCCYCFTLYSSFQFCSTYW